MGRKRQKKINDSLTRIKIIGIGGAGSAVVTRMMRKRIAGIEFLAINTDAQALGQTSAHRRLRIGRSLTRGLGTGMDPEIGQKAAEESRKEIADLLKGADLVFITCGEGGGTGTGAAPVVADILRNLGILSIAVVTKPFLFEGAVRMSIAENGIRELAPLVDAIITVPNERILCVIDKKTPLLEAFLVADEVIKQAITGIAEIITVPGLVNVDFADVKTILQGAGTALMGIGQAEGEDRAVQAAKQAVENPLLDLSIKGARGVLLLVSGGNSLAMVEVYEAAKYITDTADPQAKIIFGAVLDETMGERIKLIVVATGFPAKELPPRPMEIKITKPVALDGQSALTAETVAKEKKSKVEIKKKEPTSMSEDELDIPAFIRKKIF